ncbi:hypothetical protein N7462_007466 [Penicillium macrosclerotiorum]|uniref:uncharacterized protein n=1 Tax=Penicillium macrosclerotiorum TaxID=303699 RepID=UPI002547C544|nr:uncharacterized protein N7462_007466 [Penicillium macrosclerotiorum]KAJ5679222.1 hypothetical protein N7462_007466 [Penicillium macrosclerotiorum]
MSITYDQPIVDVAHYVFHYQINETDEEVWTRARLAFLDTIGCAIETVATNPECQRLLHAGAINTAVQDGIRVPGTDLQVNLLDGVFSFGVLLRYLDHNDALGGAEWGHPSDNLGAILPVMDWLSRIKATNQTDSTGPPLTMRTLLIALIKAYEIQGCYQMCNAFNAYGIDHVILVKLASAAVVCWLLGLTEEQTKACISHVWIDGQSIRVYRAQNNTVPRKGWAAGDAARRAVQLALYVRSGQPGMPGALSSKPWGFWACTFGDKQFEFPRPFGTWTIRNVMFKIMPVEGHGVSAVEAALLQLHRFKDRGFSNPMKDVAQMDLRTTAAANLIINKSGPLWNPADRDHCVQYVIAVAFLTGRPPNAADYSDESLWARSKEVEDFRRRIMVRPDPRLTHDYLSLEKRSFGAGLTVYLQDGSILSEILVEYPIGHVRNLRTENFLQEKFSRNMAYRFSETERDRIVDAVQDLDLPVVDLVDLLTRPVVKSNL